MEDKACCGSEARREVGEPDQSAAIGSKNHRGYLLSGILLLSGRVPSAEEIRKILSV